MNYNAATTSRSSNPGSVLVQCDMNRFLVQHEFDRIYSNTNAYNVINHILKFY